MQHSEDLTSRRRSVPQPIITHPAEILMMTSGNDACRVSHNNLFHAALESSLEMSVKVLGHPRHLKVGGSIWGSQTCFWDLEDVLPLIQEYP